jgi:fumarylacetoacetase
MTAIDKTHDATASSWVTGADTHADFPVQNLPLGVYCHAGSGPTIGTAIGDYVLDLAALNALEQLPASVATALAQPTLNALLRQPASERRALRAHVFELLTDNVHETKIARHLYPASACMMQMPAQIGDFTDFYAGIHHASNIGKQFRPDNPLLPNYKHLPIGYHGRASSVRVSGTPLIRPKGQRKVAAAELPDYGPSQRLDYELELGVWIAGRNDIGTPVPIAEAPERIAGYCLLNDWSARDIQAWEYQPLGPFLAKNFLTTISPWIITAEAMAPFRMSQPARPKGDPPLLPYLWDETDQLSGALALNLTVTLATAKMREAGNAPHQLSTGPATNIYWTVAQMIAHHTCNGCNLEPGDLLGTGTISGPELGTFGSLMEISHGGKTPVLLAGGESRMFLEDGDELCLTAIAKQPGYRSIGFGVCSGIVKPST